MAGARRGRPRGSRQTSTRRQPVSRSVSRSRSRSRSPTVRPTERDVRDERFQSIEDTQRQQGGDIVAIRDMIRELTVAMARVEKRPADPVMEPSTGVDATLPHPPPPPIVAPTVPYGGGGQPTPFRPFVAGPRLNRPPVHFELGEGSSSAQNGSQKSEKWEVDRLLKNGGRLFFGLRDPEEAIRWIDNIQSVLEHIACPRHLWVRVATGALQDAANLWWKAAHTTYLRSMPLEEIRWDDFIQAFHYEYFPETVRATKKRELTEFKQTSNMTVAEYTARFRELERFCPGEFQSERARTAAYVKGLRFSLRPLVSMFRCQTLDEAQLVAMEGEYAHTDHHWTNQIKGSDQGGRQGSNRRQKNDLEAVVHAMGGQQTQQFPRQTDSFPAQQRPTGGFQQVGQQQRLALQHPICQTCQRRHPGVCRWLTGACFNCGQMGHRASECPTPRQRQGLPQPYQQQQRSLPPPVRALAPQQQQQRQAPPAQRQQPRGSQAQRPQQVHQQRRGGVAATTVLVPKMEEGQTSRRVDDQDQDQTTRQEQTGHVYAATVDDAVQDFEVITGTLLIRSAPATVLFDSGSTHTFISCEFVPRIGVVI